VSVRSRHSCKLDGVVVSIKDRDRAITVPDTAKNGVLLMLALRWNQDGHQVGAA
jgi:hypothetical protein